MKKTLLAICVVGLCNSAFGEQISRYTGTLIDDFQEGGKFDLSTTEGELNFREHNGQLTHDQKKEHFTISNEIEKTKKQIAISESRPEKLAMDRQILTPEVLDLAELSNHVYENAGAPDGWERVIDSKNPKFSNNIDRRLTGFYGALFKHKNSGKHVVVFRGTNGLIDVAEDVVQPIVPTKSYGLGLEFVNFLKREGYPIHDLAGHSLGGGIAQYVSVSTGIPATVFNTASLGVVTVITAALNSTGIPQKDRHCLVQNAPCNIVNINFTGDVVSKIGFGNLGREYTVGLGAEGLIGSHSITTLISYGRSIDNLEGKLSNLVARQNNLLNRVANTTQYNTSHHGTPFLPLREKDRITQEINRPTVQQNPYLAKGTITLQAPVDVVLRWGDRPADLDAHLTGPGTVPNERFHIHFENKGSLTGSPHALLYRDDTSHGTGNANRPEQVRIDTTRAGRYNFYVHDFSNKGSQNSKALSQSGATVTLYSAGQRGKPEGDNLGKQVGQPIHVPKDKVGTVWHSFELNTINGTLVPKTTMSNDQSTIK